MQSYAGFADRGFSIVAVLDSDPDKVGTQVGDITVEPIDDAKEVLEREAVELAVMTVPAEQAQRVADILVDAGIRAILNFAPTRIEVPEGVTVRQADVAAELQILSFHLNLVEDAGNTE